MKKRDLMLFGLLAGIVLLASLNTFQAGSSHVEVVEEVVVLADTATKLTVQNTKLKVAADSLVHVSDSLQGTVEMLETQVDNYENKITQMVRTPAPDAYVREYRVVVPIEEVSDSTY